MRRTRLTLVMALAVATLAPATALAQPAPGTPAAPRPGQSPAPRTLRLTLEESLRAALSRSPEVRQAEAEVEGVLGKQLQARGLRYPQFDLKMILGPSPRARGNQVSSPDDQFSPDLTGMFIGTQVEIIQPIFTWGLLENARLAAEHGVRATQAGVDAKSTEVALRVKQAYWGLVVSRTIREFLVEVRDQVQDAAKRTERLIDGGYATEIGERGFSLSTTTKPQLPP